MGFPYADGPAPDAVLGLRQCQAYGKLLALRQEHARVGVLQEVVEVLRPDTNIERLLMEPGDAARISIRRPAERIAVRRRRRAAGRPAGDHECIGEAELIPARQEEADRIRFRAAQPDQLLSFLLEAPDHEVVHVVEDRLFELRPSGWLAASIRRVDKYLLDEPLPAGPPQDDQPARLLIQVEEIHRLLGLDPPEVLRGCGAIAVEARRVAAMIGAIVDLHKTRDIAGTCRSDG